MQIRKFLCFYQYDWTKKLTFPNEEHGIPKRVTLQDVQDTLKYFKQFDAEIYLQCRAAIHLVSSSGLRASELYRLKEEDIDLDNRKIYINTSKTGKGRIAIFNEEAFVSIRKYLTYFQKGTKLLNLFSGKTLERSLRDAPVKVKDLRKYFSQEWDRRGGPTSIKKILMGH